MNLYRFPGGLNLTGSLSEAPSKALLKMPHPPILEYPIRFHDGSNRKPVVTVGDSVRCGQALTALTDYRTPIVASMDGLVTSVKDTITVKPILHDNVDCTQCEQPTLSGKGTPDLAEQLFKAGIEGHGGAAFCASTKLRRLNAQSPDYLIINAVECEPLISCDRALIQHDPSALVLGVVKLAEATKAKNCLIAVESERQTEFELLKQALQCHNMRNIRVISVPTRYPTGSERQLIRVLTGIQLAPGQKPADINILCYNVGTVFAMKELIVDGITPHQRIVSVTGSALSLPQNVWVKFGTRLSDLIAFVDPALANIDTTKFELIIGGEMTGRRESDWHSSVSAATNCIQVNNLIPKPSTVACIRCGDCNTVCPENLLPQQLHWFVDTKGIETADKFGLSACIECGCCDVVCPSRIPLTQSFREGKRLLTEQQRKANLASRAQLRSTKREERLKQREKARQQRIEARKAEIEKRGSKRSPTDAIEAALARAKAKKRL